MDKTEIISLVQPLILNCKRRRDKSALQIEIANTKKRSALARKQRNKRNANTFKTKSRKSLKTKTKKKGLLQSQVVRDDHDLEANQEN